MSVQLRRSDQDVAQLFQINRQNEQRLDQLKTELSDLKRNFRSATEEKQALQVQMDEMLRQREYAAQVFKILKEQVAAVRAMEKTAIEQRSQLIRAENGSILRVVGSFSVGGVAGAFAFGPIGAVVGIGAGLALGMGSSYYATYGQNCEQAALIKRIQAERVTVTQSFIEQGLVEPKFEDEREYNPPSPRNSMSDR